MKTLLLVLGYPTVAFILFISGAAYGQEVHGNALHLTEVFHCYNYNLLYCCLGLILLNSWCIFRLGQLKKSFLFFIHQTLAVSVLFFLMGVVCLELRDPSLGVDADIITYVKLLPVIPFLFVCLYYGVMVLNLSNKITGSDDNPVLKTVNNLTPAFLKNFLKK